jgi:hypothetical protein
MWRVKIDPDSSAIPLLTALGDLLGTTLLAFAFFLLIAVGNQTAAGNIPNSIALSEIHNATDPGAVEPQR